MKYLLLQEQGNPGMFIFQFLPIILIIVVFYFFMIRPQAKKQKDEMAFRESLKKGDRIITIGGIYGHVESIDGHYVFITVDKDVKLKMAKEAIRPAPDNEAAK
jgi:preprotein translocase subunit YajC